MIKNILVFVTITVLLYSCSPNNVEVDQSLEKYFNENKVTGCFGLFDNGQGNFKIYNLTRFSDSTYTPASTFKIINSLVGIQTGRVKDSNDIFTWSGKPSDRQQCNQDMSMATAFRLSCPPWYQELARRIGKDTMQKWIDTLGYGQRNAKFQIGSNLDTFWLDNTLKVTADEQLGLAKKLYFEQLPFQQRPQRIVKGMMLQEANSNYKLSYKTGLEINEKGHPIGWVVGWIEENVHPYFFALQIESKDMNIDMEAIRLKMLKSILTQYGFFEGKK